MKTRDMKTKSAEQHEDAGTYRSGIAARLAGIPVETLRVWERRYGVVGPRLSPRGQRLYSATQIQRLALIKELVDAGHPIGVVAALTTDALNAARAMARTLGAAPAADSRQEVSIALVGPMISARQFDVTQSDSMSRIVARCPGITEAAAILRNVKADVAVIELAILDESTSATIDAIKEACGAKIVVVLYRFAPSAQIRRLRAAGHEVVHAPADAAAIESLCQALVRHSQSPTMSTAPAVHSADPPARRFDDQALAKLAEASTSVYCECPRHLAELVISLGSFERYSAGCANRGPEDAALHRDLNRTAAQARALLEDALLRVAIAEGFDVPRAMASPP